MAADPSQPGSRGEVAWLFKLLTQCWQGVHGDEEAVPTPRAEGGQPALPCGLHVTKTSDHIPTLRMGPLGHCQCACSRPLLSSLPIPR